MRKRILLVEDDRLARELIRRLLSRDEHTVIEVNNGAEAYCLFVGSRFDLVMTDFEIPFVKGNELAAQIKRLAPGQPVLMITAHKQRPGPGNPVDGILEKPVDLERLRRAMSKVFSN